MDENRIKNDPMALMFGMAIETSMTATSKIMELVNKYKANNIDVIPLSEVEACFKAGVDRAASKEGLLGMLMSD